ncbi:hypothetical protein ACHAWF_010292 [Thalassiosira exigua]
MKTTTATMAAATMSPSMEGQEDERSPTRDSDRLDALWATFRLPVPIAPVGGGLRGDRDGPSPSDGHDDWLLRALDLLRLLRVMDAPPKVGNDFPSARPKERIMEGQVALARSALAELERTFPVDREQRSWGVSGGGDDNALYRQNLHFLIEKLRTDTEDACSKVRRRLDRLSSRRQAPPERDLLYDIFLAPDSPPPATEEEAMDEFDFGEEEEEDAYDDTGVTAGGDENAQGPAPVHNQRRHPQPSRPIDPVEFQKQQQELLEQELASMAARLKDSTQTMNATLKSQTEDVDVLGELAQTNLDQVTDTTKKVEERLARNKGWKKKLATWSLIGTVLGTWVLCFMVMRTVPKRRVQLFGGGRAGGKGFWQTWKGYFSKGGRKGDGRPTWEDEMMRERERQRREQQRQRQQARDDQWRREQEEEPRRQQEEGNRRKQKEERWAREQHGRECEILGDGSQVCYDDEASQMEAKARRLAAERKQRRIEERMANAPAVDAVDSVEEEKEVLMEEGQETPDDTESPGDPPVGGGQDTGDPMGCIPVTEGIRTQQNALDSLSKAVAGLHEALEKVPEGSNQQMQQRLEKLQFQISKHKKSLEIEKNKARSVFWVDRAVRRKARDLQRALGSILFCKDEGAMGEKQPENKNEQRDGHDDSEEAERRRLEDERREQFLEKVRLEREAQENAEAEMRRLEQERRAAEETESKRRHDEEQARLTAERFEQVRLAAEKASQAELERIEQERVEQVRLLERKKGEEEARRLAAERAEAERLEQVKLATEAAKRAEVQRLEKERIERERILAEQAEAERFERERKADIAEKVRLEEEKLEKERLAAEEAARQAELEKLEQECIGQERVLAEQRRIEEEEARRLAAEAAKEEEKASRVSKAKAEAEDGARKAIELAGEHSDSDFLASDVRFAAGRLKNDLLAHYLSISPEMADASDRSGWRPIHEAARAGNLAGAQLLVSAGCDLTSRTGRTGNGGTALWWAIQRFGEGHSIVMLLRSHGALEAGPAEAK